MVDRIVRVDGGGRTVVVYGADLVRGYIAAAEGHAANAADQVDLAAAQVALAAGQVTLAAGHSANAAEHSAAASGHRDTAVAAATAASTSADSVALTDNLYATTAAGLAAVAEGAYFAVAGTGEVYATLYRKTGGVAVAGPSYPSRAALDGIGRVIGANNAIDNAVVINAALADPLVRGVQLLGVNYSVQSAIVIPSGKWLRGAGIDVTTITRVDNIEGAAYADRTMIRSAEGAIAPRVSDLTVISPKTLFKVNGVWFLTATHGLCERVKAVNCGYAFWAHEFSQHCTFRDVQSFNASVHFETTQATDILFDGMVSGDGDGDNPLGYEGVWHPLYGSKRITFRNGRHIGSGQAFLVIANDGAGDVGLIDDILFERCHVINTDSKVQLYIDKLAPTASVGTIELVGCNVETSGILAQVKVGDAKISGGQWASASPDGFQVSEGASLTALDVDVDMSANPGSGAVYISTGANAPIRVRGGRVEGSANVALATGPNVVTNDVEFVTPKKLYAPTGIGQVVRHIYGADLPLASGYEKVGTGVSGEPLLEFTAEPGFRYRFQFRGNMKKTGTDETLYIYFQGSIGADVVGEARIQRADGSFMSALPSVNSPSVVDDVRAFAVDVELTGTDNTPTLLYGAAGGATILKGASVVIERIA